MKVVTLLHPAEEEGAQAGGRAITRSGRRRTKPAEEALPASAVLPQAPRVPHMRLYGNAAGNRAGSELGLSMLQAVGNATVPDVIGQRAAECHAERPRSERLSSATRAVGWGRNRRLGASGRP